MFSYCERLLTQEMRAKLERMQTGGNLAICADSSSHAIKGLKIQEKLRKKRPSAVEEKTASDPRSSLQNESEKQQHLVMKKEEREHLGGNKSESARCLKRFYGLGVCLVDGQQSSATVFCEETQFRSPKALACQGE